MLVIISIIAAAMTFNFLVRRAGLEAGMAAEFREIANDVCLVVRRLGITGSND